MTKHCKSCNEPLIEYHFFDSANVKQSLLIHPKSLDKLPCEIDGINLEVVDQAMQNRIKETAIEQSESPKGNETKEQTKEVVEISNDDIIKRKLCNQEVTINEYDEIKVRLDK